MYHSSSITFTQCKQIDRFSVTPRKAAWQPGVNVSKTESK